MYLLKGSKGPKEVPGPQFENCQVIRQWASSSFMVLLGSRSEVTLYSTFDTLLATFRATGWPLCACGLYPHITFPCLSWLQVSGGCCDTPPRSIFRNEESLSQLLAVLLAGSIQLSNPFGIASAAQSQITQGTLPSQSGNRPVIDQCGSRTLTPPQENSEGPYEILRSLKGWLLSLLSITIQFFPLPYPFSSPLPKTLTSRVYHNKCPANFLYLRVLLSGESTKSVARSKYCLDFIGRTSSISLLPPWVPFCKCAHRCKKIRVPVLEGVI